MLINSFNDFVIRFHKIASIRKLPLDNGSTINIIDEEGLRYWNSTQVPQDIKEVQLVFLRATKKCSLKASTMV